MEQRRQDIVSHFRLQSKTLAKGSNYTRTSKYHENTQPLKLAFF